MILWLEVDFLEDIKDFLDTMFLIEQIQYFKTDIVRKHENKLIVLGAS
jgi:hypothetical protein